jgi:hypothetical protein
MRQTIGLLTGETDMQSMPKKSSKYYINNTTTDPIVTEVPRNKNKNPLRHTMYYGEHDVNASGYSRSFFVRTPYPGIVPTTYHDVIMWIFWDAPLPQYQYVRE